ncbi:MAG: septum formation protein Maf [Bacteroidales bacterium]|nr:septum formation protein Maf [Bacteroidales bacterium]
MRLLLASKSPRRRQLLSELGYPVEFINIDVDESLGAHVDADRVAETLARRKAAACPAQSLAEGDVLVTADTVVVHRDQVLGKPKSRDEALIMLRSLSGDRHTVYTGVCMRSREQEVSFTEATDVVFRRLDEDDIVYYVDKYQPYDKAGAYGVQEWIGMVGVSRLEGCYYNVMGLPVARLYEILKSKFLSR